MCAEGGFEVDICWQEGELKEAVLYAKKGGKAVIRAQVEIEVSKEGDAVRTVRDGKGRCVLETAPGDIYQIVKYA